MITLKWFNKEGISGGTFLVDIRDGVSYTDNYNEQLDSATVILEFQEKLAFEPFDIVELTLPKLGTITMLIDDFVETELDLDTHIYQYTINLMSKTKELERQPLPNFSITKPKGLVGKTVKDAIGEILEDYSPEVYVNSNLTKKYQLDSSEITALNAVSCPDLQVTKPTLREALDRVLSVDNRISVLDGNNNVKTINLNERKSEIILDEYYNYKPENQSSSDYATETENNYNNVVPNEIEGIKNDTTVTQYIGFRTEDMILTDENAVLILDNPIYELKKVVWCGVLKFVRKNSSMISMFVIDGTNSDGMFLHEPVDANGNYYFEIDITNWILESQNFNILSYEAKKSRGYYTRGNNKIEGLLKFKKSFLENYITLQNILHDALLGNRFIPSSRSFGADLTSDLPDGSTITRIYTDASSDFYIDESIANDLSKHSMFKITYEAQNENVRSRTSKYLPERNQQNVIIDNPGEAYVDIKRQGELFTQKCNRLGNRVQYLNARFPIDHDIPELGDYYQDKVLIRREIQFYDDYIIFKGTLTENYVNINYFTGINARKRSWNLVSAGEAFDKELLEKWYAVFTFDSNTGTDSMNIGEASDVLSYFTFCLLQVFYYDADTHPLIDHAWVYNALVGDQYAKVEMDLTSYISGNSLIFNAKADDNYSLGIRLIGPTTGGMEEAYIPYAHPEGYTTTWFKFYLINRYTPGGVPVIYNSYSNQEISSFLNFSQMKPLMAAADNDGRILFKNTFYNHKDSREKLGFNIQFEFVSDTPDIIIGEKFMERQMFVNTIERNNVRIYSSNYKYKITDRTFNGGTLVGNQDNIGCVSITKESASLNIHDLNYSGDLNSIAITDSDDKLILAINTTILTNPLTVYLKMQSFRDRHNYSNRSLKTWENDI